MSQDIKNIYNDALYWATSPQSKEKGYHISRVHDSVLRKLIHYCKNKELVYYTNDVIAKHTYLGEEQIKKSIPLLDKKRFINCSYNSRRDDNGNIIKRRAISINWKMFEKIMDDLPNSTATLIEENQVDSEFNNDIVDKATLVAPKDITNDNAEKVVLKFKQDDMVSLEYLFENFGIDLDLAVEFLLQFRSHFDYEEKVRFGEVIKYVHSIVKEQKYKDYKGVRIDNDIADRFNNMMLQ